MRKKRLYIIAGTAFLLLAVMYAASEVIKGAEQPVEPVAEEAAAFKAGGERYPVITGFCFGEYSSGMKKYEIRADEVSIRPKRIGFLKTPLIKETHMKKPEILFYEKDEEVSRIAANSGKINMSNRKILLNGDVRLITAGGEELSAETMSVNPENGLLSVKGKFILKRDGSIINGRGIKSDITLNKVSIGKK